MNCGIAGDAMRFLQISTSDGAISTQGQFTKGVMYLNALKSSAGDLIMQYQAECGSRAAIRCPPGCSSTPRQIGLVEKEAGSSWRSRLFGWSNQEGKKSQALNWVFDKAGLGGGGARPGLRVGRMYP